MNAEEYGRLCDVCDRILSGPGASVERMSIPWLHVLSEHPALLGRYDALLSGTRPSLPRPLRSLLSQGRDWVRSLRPGGGEEPLPPRAEVLFVSHLLNESQIGASQDFYFGDAPEHLHQEGLSSLVLLMNWTKRDARGLGNAWGGGSPRRVFRAALPARRELSMRRRLSRAASTLRQEGRAAADDWQRRAYDEAASQALSGSTIYNLRLYEQMRDVIRRVGPRAIVVTYEGHAWERLAFMAAREADPATRCIGYHHTILLPRHHAVLRPLGPGLDPDVIVTAGEVTRRRFAAAYEGTPTRVAVMGMHRRLTQASAPTRWTERPRACLVIPEGLPAEVVLLFDFAIAAAAAAPDVTFILRLHPILSMAELQRQYPRFRNLPPNVTTSTADIREDFARSRWALYRGSNAAIYAVIAGVRPLYVERSGELSIDCMHELNVWKTAVRSADDVRRVTAADEGDTAEAVAAAEYCSAFFMAPDYGVLSDAIR